MKKKKVLEMLAEVVLEQKGNGQWGTAHVYRSTSNSFSSFLSLYKLGVDISFPQLTPALLKSYESHLREKGCSWNTVATYMKMLKAVYNRAVDQSLATFVPRLFKHVRTTPCNERKRALDTDEMHRILQTEENDLNRFHHLQETSIVADKEPAAEHSEEADRAIPDSVGFQMNPSTARQYFILMFLLRGIPFVDIAYLKQGDIRRGVLYYRRRKTGKPLCVALTKEAEALIERLRNRNTHPSDYLFPFLRSPEGSEKAYREYQSALRCFNRHLKELPRQVGGCFSPLSSYAARHTWATMAYHCEVHPGIISEAMGHSSIAITEIYLKPFQNEKIDLANRQVIDYVKHFSC